MKAYMAGDKSARVEVLNSLGEPEWLWMNHFFREPQDWSALEQAALELTQGRVLDVGAGAGTFALALQQRNRPVCAIDIAPEAVRIMQAQGVREAYAIDYFDLIGQGDFDTLFFMMNGIGIAGNLEGLERLFAHADHLLSPGGRIVLDSSDLSVQSPEALLHRGLQSAPDDRYSSVVYQLRFGQQIGQPYRWLFADPDMLTHAAHCQNFWVDIVLEEENGHYLAQAGRQRERI